MIKPKMVIASEDFFTIPGDFSLAQAICSYGYFALAPNHWTPAKDVEHEDQGTFTRPFRIGEDGRDVVWATIRQVRIEPQDHAVAGGQEKEAAAAADTRGRSCLRVELDRKVADKNRQQQLMQQVARMLRIDIDVSRFHSLCPEAKQRGFGRLFRSPCLWEDMVKTISNCNMKWSGTVRMNHLLCKLCGKEGSFPTPHEIATHSADWLKENCKLGYRAERVLRLALAVLGTEGHEHLDLEWLEDEERTSEEAFVRVKQIYGFGKFAAYNVCQLLGHFDSFPYDSETVRHFKDCHGVGKGAKFAEVAKKAERHYARYEPFQFLAYWFELWVGYEKRRGRTSTRWTVRNNQTESSQLFDVSKKKKSSSSKKKRTNGQLNESSEEMKTKKKKTNEMHIVAETTTTTHTDDDSTTKTLAGGSSEPSDTTASGSSRSVMSGKSGRSSGSSSGSRSRKRAAMRQQTLRRSRRVKRFGEKNAAAAAMKCK